MDINIDILLDTNKYSWLILILIIIDIIGLISSE